LARLFGTVRRPRKNTEKKPDSIFRQTESFEWSGVDWELRARPDLASPAGPRDTVVVVMTLFSKITGEVDKADAAFDALVRPRLHSSALRTPSTEDFIFPPRGSTR